MGIINDLESTEYFKFADCFCSKKKFCSFSYAKPDSTKCEIERIPMRKISNCHGLKTCEYKRNCDGLYFDGNDFFHVFCNSNDLADYNKLIEYKRGVTYQYFIQLKEC